MNNVYTISVFVLLLAGGRMNRTYAQQKTPDPKFNAYLFAYFTGNSKSEEAIHFALSNDGYHYRALNSNKPVIPSEKISSTGGVRDPHILRGADGKTFYMVATDMVSANGWNSNRAMVLLKSTDLVNWASSIVNIQKRFSGNDSLLRVWAPQTIWDPQAKKYLIYFSMNHGNDPDKIYYAYANKAFTDLETEPKQLFYHPQSVSCIDGDIVYALGKYHLFFKTEGSGNGIKKAVSDKLTEGYEIKEDRYLQQTTDAVEGAGTFRLNQSNEWILMYDVYMKGKYQFTKTKDLQQFKAIDEEVSMNFHPRHGTIMPITAQEAAALMRKWGAAEDVLQSAQSKWIKRANIAFDTATKSLTLPVKRGANLRSFHPQFINFPGTTITPNTPQNFADRLVRYTVTINGRTPQTFNVFAKEYRNPVLEGFYADPDIIYAEKTGRFYIYPTSDGFNNWSGTYFKAFSSPNLVAWKDEGVILDLNKDVTWAKRNAWAPCIVEKKIGGQYKYFYYFTAAQKIGVAVADHPAGPFVDSGKPLIEALPEGIRGQVIDPDVFTDPKTGRSYLYWGNGFMAGAELNDDMVSLKSGTTKLLTPDTTFREGTHVFLRNGIYYFLWSENDTRDADYRVRYGTSDGPLGNITVPANNLVIAKDTTLGIFATGHNATIQIPGRDAWYIVYHRFTYPAGIGMGQAAGYNREVCIDKLEFDEEGRIRQVAPTHAGIEAVGLKK